MPAPIALSETDEFLDAVVTDGRFISEFSRHPLEVAAALERPLSEEAAMELMETPSVEALERLFERRYSTTADGDEPAKVGVIAIAAVVAGAAIGVVIAIGISEVVVTVKLSPPLEKPRNGAVPHDTEEHLLSWWADRSPQRDSKL